MVSFCNLQMVGTIAHTYVGNLVHQRSEEGYTNDLKIPPYCSRLYSCKSWVFLICERLVFQSFYERRVIIVEWTRVWRYFWYMNLVKISLIIRSDTNSLGHVSGGGARQHISSKVGGWSQDLEVLLVHQHCGHLPHFLHGLRHVSGSGARQQLSSKVGSYTTGYQISNLFVPDVPSS